MSTEYKEIGRISVSDSTYIVLSSVHSDGELKGYNISKFISTEHYTGFAKGGISIPADSLEDFLGTFSKVEIP